jgi:DNA-binding NarL/FixJ family response regulator
MLTTTRTIQPATSESDRATATSPRLTRLLVVDDHPAVRVGLVQLLEAQRDFTIEAVCVNAEGAVARAEHEEIDVAVLDYYLGGHNGLWVCRRMKEVAAPPRVIIFSAFANDHLAACSAVAGVDAVLNKGVLGSDLCDAVRSVARGRRLLPRVAAPLADMLRRRLGDAEQPLFGMLLAGRPQVEIEEVLCMCARELASRRAAILRKLEPLPGEVTRPGRAGERIDVERILRQPTWPAANAG